MVLKISRIGVRLMSSLRTCEFVNGTAGKVIPDIGKETLRKAKPNSRKELLSSASATKELSSPQMSEICKDLREG